MTLEVEIAKSSKEIYTDGYDMSIGEIVSLYKDKELVISPEFQRLFRWKVDQKSKFIESLLLGIPIPPIFVFQNPNGIWELVDGLQRLSTILEFMGELRDSDGEKMPPSVLEGTRLLPSLDGKTWDGSETIGKANQIAIKRVRIRVEILKKDSELSTKFELFQRLNTGGSTLTPQEVRNSMIVMIDAAFFERLKKLSQYPNFISSLGLTTKDRDEQREIELVTRLMAYLYLGYDKKYDLNEYLDDSVSQLINIGVLDDFEKKFKWTFDNVNNCLGRDAFRRREDGVAKGQFLISAFEVVAYGIIYNYDKLTSRENLCDFLEKAASDLWSNERYRRYSGTGVRATQRVPEMIALGKDLFSNED